MTISHQIVRCLQNESRNPRQVEDKEIDLDEHLRSASKKILQKIEFVESSQSNTFDLHKLKSKYVVLNPSTTEMKETKMISTSKMSSCVNSDADDGVPSPKKVFFPQEKIELSWRKPARAGAGLCNLGNTCFLNSALQCLTYTAPLANYLIHMNHRKHCRVNGQFCMLCAMQQHFGIVHGSAGQAVKPMCILKNLRMIAKHLQFGRQEDAHEFIRYSIDAMQKSCLFGYPNKIDVHTKATTAVHQIFGGYLRSSVRCKHCRSVSDTYDPFLDLSLDISKQGCVDLQKCLEIFVRAEILQGDNSYKCAFCKNTVQAIKKFSVHRPPNVLMIQLKRFSNFFGNKINKEISYPSKLNLAPYMSNKPDNGLWYELYAVLVHSGYSCQSGHYYAYAKVSNGQWYCFNDASVHQVSVNQALNQQAYLLFYARSPKAASQIGNLKLKKSLYGKNLLGIPSQKQELMTEASSCGKVGIKESGCLNPGLTMVGSHSHPTPKKMEDKSFLSNTSGPQRKNISEKPTFTAGTTNQLSKSASFRTNHKQVNGKTELNMNKNSTLPTKLNRSQSSSLKGCLSTSKWSQSTKNLNEVTKPDSSSVVVNSKTSALRSLVSYSSDDSSESESEDIATTSQPSLYSSISSTLKQIRQSCSSAVQLVKGKNEETKVSNGGEALDKPHIEKIASSPICTEESSGRGDKSGEQRKKDSTEREPILDVLHGEMNMECGNKQSLKEDESCLGKEDRSCVVSLCGMLQDRGGIAKDLVLQSPSKNPAKESKKRHLHETEEETECKKKRQISADSNAPSTTHHNKFSKREMKTFNMFSLENSNSKKRKVGTANQHFMDAAKGKTQKYCDNQDKPSAEVGSSGIENEIFDDSNRGIKIKQRQTDVKTENNGKHKSFDSLFCDSQKYAANMKKKAKRRKKHKEMLERKLQSSYDEDSSDSSNHSLHVEEDGRKGLKQTNSLPNLIKDEKGEKQRREESANSKLFSSFDSSIKARNAGGEIKENSSDCLVDNQASGIEIQSRGKERLEKVQKCGKPKERPNILAQLLRQSSGRAYGAKVDTWSGDDSLVEKDAEKTWNGQQVALVDDWDKEYDQGKTRKVKKKEREEKSNNGNLFQKFQDLKNQRSL